MGVPHLIVLAAEVFMKKLRSAFEFVEEGLIGLVLITMLTTILAQVFARYVADYPLSWTEELARYLFVWLVFLGASQAMRRGEHIAVGLIIDALPSGARRVVSLVIQLMIAAFLAVMIVQGFRVVTTVAPLPSIALKVSMAAVYLAVPVAGIAMLGRTLATIYIIIRRGAPEVGAQSF